MIERRAPDAYREGAVTGAADDGHTTERGTPYLASTLAEPTTTDAPTSRRWWFPLGVFLLLSVVLALVVWLTGLYLPRAPAHAPPASDIRGGPLIEGWVRWDAGWYIRIVRDGYFYIPGTQSSIAFFPAYPILLWAATRVIGDHVWAGMAVTWASGLAVALLFGAWCRARLAPLAAGTAVTLLLAFPYAWFLYGSIYADALFLAAVLASFTLLEHDRPWLAGLAGAVATAARPIGIAVVVGLVVRALERRGALRLSSGRFGIPTGVHLGRVRGGDVGVLVSLGGLASYCIYLWVRFGDPLAFAAVQGAPGWNQGSGPPTWFKASFFEQILRVGRFDVTKLVIQAVLTVVALGLIPFVVRRFGWGYGLFALAVVALPAISTKDFQGMGRYLLAAFPCFAVAGDLLAHQPRLRVLAIAGSGFGLLLMASLSARGYYLT